MDTSQERFRQLLDRHRGIVFKVANSYSRGREEREDLAQEICAQLWHAFPRYQETRRFSTWMYRVALNVAISYARSQRWSEDERFDSLDEQHLEIACSVGPSVTQDESLRTMYAFIAGLNPLNRALILLYLDEHSYVEIGEVLGISETNVATRISRIRKTLREQMTGKSDNTDGEQACNSTK